MEPSKSPLDPTLDPPQEGGSACRSNRDFGKNKPLALHYKELEKDKNVTPIEQSKHLDDLLMNIRRFSEYVKDSYAKQALQSDIESCTLYQQIRNSIKNDVFVYANPILDLTKFTVLQAQHEIEYFTDLEYEELMCEFDEMDGYLRNVRGLCEITTSILEEMLRVQKKKKDQVKTHIDQETKLKEKLEERRDELNKLSKKKKDRAKTLVFIPLVQVISPFYFYSSRNDAKKALVKDSEAKAVGTAAAAFEEIWITALKSEISAMATISGYISELENGMERFRIKGKKWWDDGNNKNLKRFSELMKKNAVDVLKICYEFIRVLPDVRSDLLSIFNPDPYNDDELDHQYILQQCMHIADALKEKKLEPETVVENLKALMSREINLLEQSSLDTST